MSRPSVCLWSESCAALVWDPAQPEAQRLDEIVQVFQFLAKNPAPAQIDVVPAYNSLAVYFEPKKLWTPGQLPSQMTLEYLRNIPFQEGPAFESDGFLEIPVRYGGQKGPDITAAAQLLQLTVDQLITLHSEVLYRVAMVGFLPGFPYLAGLPEALFLPRKSTPSPAVPAGSVAIGGKQTGIYSQTSPGGWHIIGWTPLKLFDVNMAAPALFKPGQRVKFVPIL